MEKRRLNLIGFSVTFIALFIFWLIISGEFNLFPISLGVISSALVAYISHDLFFTRTTEAKSRFPEVARFIKYIPWLAWQIVLGNIHVVYLVLHPRMPIDPEIVIFKTKLKKDISLTALANSITLTPGTITVDIKEGEYYVHALSKKATRDLLGGEMGERVVHIFRED